MSAVFDLFQRSRGRSIKKADQALQQHRMSKCIECPLYGKYAHGICGLVGVEGCGCIIKQKVQYLQEKCPKNKW